MEWFKIEKIEKQTTAFARINEHSLTKDQEESMRFDELDDEGKKSFVIGGLICKGEYAWLTRRNSSDAILLVCCLKTGFIVARHKFGNTVNNENDDDNQLCYSIRYVEELFPEQAFKRETLLAICLETWTKGNRHNTIETHLDIYSIKCNMVLRHIHLDGLLATTLNFLKPEICSRTHFHNFDGVLAVGTKEGTILLLDLNFDYVQNTRRNEMRSYLDNASDTQIERISIQSGCANIETLLKESRDNDNHLALVLDAADIAISSLMSIDLIDGFAAGLTNGQIILYDLRRLKLIATLYLPENLGRLSVERLCCIVPPDDPKPCFYLSAMYQSKGKILALLHVLSFKRSYAASDNHLNFEQFQSSSTCAQIQLDGPSCRIIDCLSASTFSFAGDNGTLLLILSWYSHTDRINKLVLFDINQWYKDEMPYLIRPCDKPNCLAGYLLNGPHDIGLSLQFKPSSILHFKSSQRSDVHFYPNSLSFGCHLMTIKGFCYYAHVGLQSRFIECLRQETPTLFLIPHDYHNQIIRLGLMPQFSELNASATFSRTAMYEEILSVALEQKCLALLYKCARSWLDDSFLCNMVNPTELSLSTLTNWITRRTINIKSRCLELCQGIFDYNGYSLDEREKEEFCTLSIQLEELIKLQSYIINQGKGLLSESVLDEYETNVNSMEMIYQYQWLLYWFMERGLLPEGNLLDEPNNKLTQLKRVYDERRIRRKSVDMPLYIDTMLQRYDLAIYMCDGQYPPSTIQALMRMMLSSNAKLAQKHEVVMYLLIDLENHSNDPKILKKKYEMGLLEKFQFTFKITNQMMQLVKSFWHLDRDEFGQSVDALFHFNSTTRNHEDWQVKLLINNLLLADAPRMAMRLIFDPPGPISCAQYMSVLLAANRIGDAFHYARLYDDDEGRPLLENFFRQLIKLGEFKVLTNLFLTEDEEQMVYRALREAKTHHTDTLHLILLLQRRKYIEAVSFMDEIAVERRQSGDETCNKLLTFARATMGPVTQSLADTYFQIREKLDGCNVRDNSSPVPFSCQLAKQSANDMDGGLFYNSALSAHWTTTYDSSDDGKMGNQNRLLLSCHNMPFLRPLQFNRVGNAIQHQRRIVHPVPYQPVEKRQRIKHERESPKSSNYVLQPRKRRRLIGEQMVTDLQEFFNQKNLKEEQQQHQQQQQSAAAAVVPPPAPAIKPAAVVAPAAAAAAAVAVESISSVPQPRLLFNRYESDAIPSTSQAAAKRSIHSRESINNSSTVNRINVKEFYFTPPIPLESSIRDEVQLDEDEDETDEIIMEIESRSGQQQIPGGDSSVNKIKGRGSIYFAPPIPLDAIESDGETDEIIVEIESRDSQQEKHIIPDSESDESDQFMSPLTSANVSLVTEQDRLPVNENAPIAPPTGPQPRHSLLQSRTESSSGFGSFTTASMRLAHTASSRDFVPTVCSSKMGETYVKMSERTTICGDLLEMTERSEVLMPSSTISGWSMRTTATTTTTTTGGPRARQLPEMLDTTLGMSSYDITCGMEHPIEQMEVEDDDEEEENQQQQQQQQRQAEEEEEINQSATYEEVREENEQQQTIEDDDQQEENSSYNHPFMTGSRVTDETAAVDPSSVTHEENLSSPTYSISSELSELSSTEVRPLATSRIQDDPMYSIVVESTGSITTSRSVTHTPTSFLPSDTNVSQNSSPRAPHGGAGSGPGGLDGSPRSLYRANSLETVDDLDTTKGSLDDDDDDDDENEDDCVIALDGTEVRGYVPRPQQTTACSSAELFAFKDDDAAATGSARPNPSLSLGATVNSDSVIAETINLDTDEDEDKNKDDNVKVVNPSSNDDSMAIAIVNQSEEIHQVIEEEVSNDVELVVVEKPSLQEKEEELLTNDEPPLPMVAKQPLEKIYEELEEEGEVSKDDDLVLVEKESTKEKDEEVNEPLAAVVESKQILQEIQEEEEEPEVPALKEIPEEENEEEEEEEEEEVSSVTKNEETDPPLDLAFSEDENELSTFQPTPVRNLRSNSPSVVNTPPFGDLGMGLRRLKRRLHSEDRTITTSPIPQSHISSPSSRLTRAASTPPASSVSTTTPNKLSKRRLSTQKHLFEAIEEHTSSGDGTQSPGPQTRSRSRLSLEAEQQSLPIRERAGTPQKTTARNTKRSSSIVSDTGPTTSYRRKLRSNSEPPTPVKDMVRVLPQTKTSKHKSGTSGESSEQRSMRAISAIDDQPSTSSSSSSAAAAAAAASMRTLRRRRTNSETESNPTPSSSSSSSVTTSQTVSQTSTPEAVINEANVPPKKRGRPKK